MCLQLRRGMRNTRSWEGSLRLCFQCTCAGTVAGWLVACSSSGDPSAAPGADGGVAESGVAAVKVASTVLIANTSDAGAAHVDPDLVNAWGLAFAPNGIAWISDNGTGKATLFPPSADAGPLASIVVPAPAAAKAEDAGATSTPTGMVLNQNSSAFLGDVFIAATADGTIAGWQPSTPATFQIRVDRSAGAPASNAVYRGLAIVPTSPPTLVAANIRSTIDVFNSSYQLLVSVAAAAPRAWVDTSLPAGYAPYNVVTIGQSVYVAFALQNSAKNDATPGAGLGAVSVFDFNGNLLKSLIPVGGALDAPWGMAVAPSSWGTISGDLLVGNFGAGNVNAFEVTTGKLTAELFGSTTNSPLVIPGLWALVFGDDADAGVSPNALYFTAGPDNLMNGLYGVLTLAQ
jgi:uncharacterized protein (TIGR03118 family)